MSDLPLTSSLVELSHSEGHLASMGADLTLIYCKPGR